MSPAVAGGDRRITDLRLTEVASETISKTNQQTKLQQRYNKNQKKSRRDGGKDGERERIEKAREAEARRRQGLRLRRRDTKT